MSCMQVAQELQGAQQANSRGKEALDNCEVQAACRQISQDLAVWQARRARPRELVRWSQDLMAPR